MILSLKKVLKGDLLDSYPRKVWPLKQFKLKQILKRIVLNGRVSNHESPVLGANTD